jgi:hypothetical protein
MYLFKLLVFQGIQILVRAPEPSVSTNVSRVGNGKNQSEQMVWKRNWLLR